MRKTQVALAALALVASTAALAEVKISGTLEGAIGNTNTAGNSGTYLSGAGGWVGGNNIRFSGEEDIGGGLKAVFGLEAGTDLNGYANNGGGTYGGTTAPQDGAGLFSREASVGLASDTVGTIKLGRQLSPTVANYATNGTLGNGHFWVNRLANVGGGHVAAPGSLAYEGFWVDNAVTYTAPTIGGISISAMKQMSKGNTNGLINIGAADDSYTSIAASTSISGWNLGVGYEKRAETFQNMAFNGTTKFGDFSVAGSYHTNKDTAAGTKKNSYSLEAGYNITEPLMVMVQYAANDATTKSTLSALSVKYTMSKRTFAYATILDAKAGNSGFDSRNATASDNRTTLVGVAHSF
jgi:predicted porin